MNMIVKKACVPIATALLPHLVQAQESVSKTPLIGAIDRVAHAIEIKGAPRAIGQAQWIYGPFWREINISIHEDL
ncbi:MAG TPA: hypothetical protein VLZ54_01805 [Arenibacter sp.]|nr:hypothetical protein [Arenibacter sp.]